MDRLLVEGVGGFTTRNEFVREAIESYLLELTHEPAPPSRPRSPGTVVAVSQSRRASSTQANLNSSTSTRARVRCRWKRRRLRRFPPTCRSSPARAHVVAEPLFGMHNRDYPSLWVARRLVEFLGDGPLLFDEFAERATEDAWSFAEGLLTLESESGKKLTALFPTNTEKRQTASSAFRVFAIGAVGADGGPRAEGALFLWRVITVQANERGYLAARQRGLTDSKAVQARRRYAVDAGVAMLVLENHRESRIKRGESLDEGLLEAARGGGRAGALSILPEFDRIAKDAGIET